MNKNLIELPGASQGILKKLFNFEVENLDQNGPGI